MKGRTDRYDEANIRFGNVANELNNDKYKYLSGRRPTAEVCVPRM